MSTESIGGGNLSGYAKRSREGLVHVRRRGDIAEPKPQNEEITYLGNPVEFYPKAPDRRPTQDEIAKFEDILRDSAPWLIQNPNVEVKKEDIITPDSDEIKRISINWKYNGEQMEGTHPQIDAFIYKPEQGVILFKRNSLRSGIKYAGVSAVNLSEMQIFVW